MKTNYDQALPPAFRKEYGVFYTQQLVAKYIIEQTIGNCWADNQSFEALQNIKVLDNACGDGVFLCEAFAFLQQLYQTHFPTIQNTAHHIVTHNLFGVDIDKNSVELTKSNLQKLSKTDLDLSPNIKQGNSLISDKAVTDLAFDWQQAFPFQFDVVVGNPPYTYRNTNNEHLKPYYHKHYKVSEGNYEAYKFFIEKSLNLLKAKGKLGFITSASFLVQSSFYKLRQLLVENTAMELLAPLGGGVFDEATVDTIILVCSKPQKDNQQIKILVPTPPMLLEETQPYTIAQDRLKSNPDLAFDYLLNDNEHQLLNKLFQTYPSLEQGFEFGVGINTGYIRNELVADKKINEHYHLMVAGDDISRYGVVNTSGWIMYDKEFVKSKKDLGRSLPDKKFFDTEKILVVRTRNLSLKRRIIATIDKDKKYNLNRLSNIIAKEGYQLNGLLGILNSNLFQWIFSKKFFDYEIKPIYLKVCPLADVNNPQLNLLTNKLLANYQEIEELSSAFVRLLPKDFSPKKISKKLEKWFDLNFQEFVTEVDKGKPQKKLNAASFKIKLQIEKDFVELQNEVVAKKELNENLEKQINQLVYQLYNLTAEEIALISNKN